MKTDNNNKILSDNLFPVVGIGASAGGFDAFKKLLKAITPDSGMAYVLVQHLDPTHESMLAELLQKVTKIPVLEITDDIKVEPNHIYILPSNKMMVANDGVLQLTPRVIKKNERNLPIDLFFNSLADVHQSHAIGVVLSGTGSDGTKGLKSIKDHGGLTFAQDEKSAAYDGMPNSAIQADVVDFILSPDEIPKKLLEITPTIGKTDEALQHLPQHDEEMFRQMLTLLRLSKGTDFTYYKQTTIRRRILRRMALNKNEDLGSYLTFLRENKPEQDILYQDLLIPVTSFFRDTKVFDGLCESVFPHIMKNKNAADPIRIWVVACSTGQEAYSIAICLKEFLGDTHERVQIFATDLNPQAIIKARIGIYAKKELDGVPPKRLKEFFTKTEGGYQVNKQVREMCVFAAHNFLKDPPFGKVDFISCRNVLIYMEAYLQKKALTTFHYALNPKGLLLLGKSETSTSVPDLFSVTGKQDKLFTRKDVPGRFMFTTSPRAEQNMQQVHESSQTESSRTDFQKTADDIMLSKYTPAGVVVNEAMDIVHFRGKTSNFLEQLPGTPSHNLLQLAKEGLAFELRNILYKVRKEKKTILKENIPIGETGNPRNISIEALPLPDTIEPHYLILFHDNRSARNQSPEINSKKDKAGKIKKDANNLRIQQLEQELAQSRDDMRAITEDQEAVNEELQTANEELMSGSEELQSLNEELETSKEELQSTNEELTVINHEMIGLNEQVTFARKYADDIIATIREPLLVLDKSMRIQSANNAFYKTFQVNEQETEGKSIYDIGDKQWNIPELKLMLGELLPKKIFFSDFEVCRRFPAIGERVMLLNAREIARDQTDEKLILLSIEDITEKANARKKIEESEAYFRQIADLMPSKISNSDTDGNVLYFNKNWLDYTGLNFDELKGQGYYKIIHPDELEEFQNRFQQASESGITLVMEMRFLNKYGEYKWHLNLASPVKQEDGKINMWVGSTTEIHEQLTEKAALEEAVKARTKELEYANTELVFQNKEKGKRSAELNLANKELKFQNEEKEKRAVELLIANKELESFTYISSHDLQEPLRKIQTFSNRILADENDSLTDKARNYFSRIQASANRMQTLIQDLLVYSHTNEAERTYQKINLNQLLEIVKSELAELITDKHVIFNAADLGEVKVNPSQFRQVMNNLVSNTLKFSNPGQDIIITIKTRIGKLEKFEEEDPDLKKDRSIRMNNLFSPGINYCHVKFTDNGIGFDPLYKKKIFEVFQRLHGKAEYAGTGIGLAIVKKIIQHHGGAIFANGKLGKGASFDIYIPA